MQGLEFELENVIKYKPSNYTRAVATQCILDLVADNVVEN